MCFYIILFDVYFVLCLFCILLLPTSVINDDDNLCYVMLSQVSNNDKLYSPQMVVTIYNKIHKLKMT